MTNNAHVAGAVITLISNGSLGNLIVLDLSDNQIGDAGMIALANAIKPTTENPMGSLANLILLFLSGNKIGDEGMKALSSAIASGSLGNLIVLDLSDNHIGDKGMEAFSSAIASGSLPSLYYLLVGRPWTENGNLKAACRAHRPYVRLK